MRETGSFSPPQETLNPTRIHVELNKPFHPFHEMPDAKLSDIPIHFQGMDGEIHLRRQKIGSGHGSETNFFIVNFQNVDRERKKLLVDTVIEVETFQEPKAIVFTPSVDRLYFGTIESRPLELPYPQFDQNRPWLNEFTCMSAADFLRARQEEQEHLLFLKHQLSTASEEQKQRLLRSELLTMFQRPKNPRYIWDLYRDKGIADYDTIIDVFHRLCNDYQVYPYRPPIQLSQSDPAKTS